MLNDKIEKIQLKIREKIDLSQSTKPAIQVMKQE
jgi:hypothetical protein